MLLPNHFAKDFRAPFARQDLITHAGSCLYAKKEAQAYISAAVASQAWC
jgi:hypothetical protein